MGGHAEPERTAQAQTLAQGTATGTDGGCRSDEHQHTGTAGRLVVGADADGEALSPARMVLARPN